MTAPTPPFTVGETVIGPGNHQYRVTEIVYHRNRWVVKVVALDTNNLPGTARTTSGMAHLFKKVGS